MDYPNHCPGAPLTSGGTYSVSKPDKLDNLNTYIGYLKSNNTDHINDFEIEASVASKISILAINQNFSFIFQYNHSLANSPNGTERLVVVFN